MNIAQHSVEPSALESAGKGAGVPHIRKSHVAVALEPEMQEVEVLRDDRVRRTREIERERVLDGAEVVQLKDEVFGEVFLRAPDDPSHTDIGKTEFVAGGVDGYNTGNFEIPFKLGLKDWRLGCAAENDTKVLTVANGAMNAPEAPSTESRQLS